MKKTKKKLLEVAILRIGEAHEALKELDNINKNKYVSYVLDASDQHLVNALNELDHLDKGGMKNE